MAKERLSHDLSKVSYAVDGAFARATT